MIILIHGAGIAGLTLAREIKNRGIDYALGARPQGPILPTLGTTCWRRFSMRSATHTSVFMDRIIKTNSTPLLP